jgi:hypothetical protein
MNTFLCIRWPARIAAGALAACLGLAALPAQALNVQCHVNYGGEDRVMQSPPTATPLAAHSVEVGSYFLVRLVNTLTATQQPAFKVYVYAAHDSGPAPIHTASHSPRQVRQGKGFGGFTGVQRVYEPVRDGELTYWCERATPARHARAQTTAPNTTQTIVPVASAPATTTTATASAFPRETPDDQLPKATSAYRDTASQSAQPGVVRLVMAGDVMLADGPGQTIANVGDPLALFDAALRSGDYNLGNLELPVASVGKPLESKIFSFRADPEVMRVLKGRFNALSVANNHSGDYGQAAFLETLQHLSEAGIAQVGGGRNLAEAHRPLWIRQNGLSIAVLAYNEFKPRSFEAGPDWPGVAWSEDDRVVADITAARRAGADVIIPFMHWGWERERQPTDRQRQLARLMIDAGADLVVGGHPHVTQGVDTYKGKLIVYSLGNFVFDSFENVPGGQTGWLLRLTLDKHGLLNWDTLTAQMDLAGTPHPVPGAWSPCGQAKLTAAPAHVPRQTSGPGQVQRVVNLARCVNP